MQEGEENYIQLRENYGDIVSGRLFSTVFIVLNSYEAVKETYIIHGDCTSGRPQMNTNTRIDKGKGIINSEGEIWMEHRRFVLSSLRDFGFGKVGSESIIREELEQLCAFLAEAGSSGTKAVDPRIPLARSSTNVICTLVFGQRCGTEEEFESIQQTLRDFQQDRVNKLPLILLLILSVLLKIPGDIFRLKKMFVSVDKMLDYVEAKIDEHRKKHCVGREADLIDSYLTTQAEREKVAPGKHTFTDPQLLRVIFELFLAGSDGIATMVRWSLFLMAAHPNIQVQVQQELSEMLEGRLPAVSDRSVLKYTDAVLHEVHRYVVLTPLGGPLHRVTEQVYIRGYRLPKNAAVMTNLFAIFRDPKHWPHPNEFNPENFYDRMTKSLVNTEYVIPFLIGRRACPGESLAKQHFFVFFAGLLQRFTVRFDPTDRNFSMLDTVITGFNRTPPDFKLQFIPRK